MTQPLYWTVEFTVYTLPRILTQPHPRLQQKYWNMMKHLPDEDLIAMLVHPSTLLVPTKYNAYTILYSAIVESGVVIPEGTPDWPPLVLVQDWSASEFAASASFF